MAVTKISFGSMQEFADWAAEALVPDYFGAVGCAAGTFTGYRDTEKTEPVWALAPNGQLTAWKDGTHSRSVVANVQATGVYPKAAWCCRSGILLEFAEAQKTAALIAKTNRSMTATVIGATEANTKAYFYSGLYCTAWGDDPGVTAGQTWTPREANQTALVPFPTDAQSGAVSFLPKAFYLPEGQFYGMGYGKFTADGKTYLTNGYWALAD